MTPKKLMKKICLLGDGAVGKTSLIRKFVFDSFDDKYIMTFGTKVSKKDVTMVREGQEFNMTFLIWDILGQRVHNTIHSAYYQGA
jgi:GTPase SAR1 family protein